VTRPDKIPENDSDNLLTGIQHAYTVGDNQEPETEEMNELMIKNFLNTLADISLSIAARKGKETD